MQHIDAKTILSGYADNNSWFGTNYNMNIYKGCCHGCIYCDSRSDCYRVEDFDTVRVKKNAIDIIGAELKSKQKKGVVGTGAMSDPYNPFEKELQLTRSALKLIDRNGFGAAIATKSSLITRDMDILKSIKTHSPVLCKITVTAFDDKLSEIIEPYVNPSSERFKAIEKLSSNGIYAGILLMPVLPFITDSTENILKIVKAAHEAGARFIYPGFGVTLRSNQKAHYYMMLDKLFPGLREKYISEYGNIYRCPCQEVEKLCHEFEMACHSYGILYEMKDIIADYKKGYGIEQLSML